MLLERERAHEEERARVREEELWLKNRERELFRRREAAILAMNDNPQE